MDDPSTTAKPGAESDPRSGSDTEILGQCLNELGEAHDRSAVVACYCQRYPDLADKIRELAEMAHLLAGSRIPVESDGASRAPEWLGPYHVRRLIGRGGM